jgi:hypothetical protein
MKALWVIAIAASAALGPTVSAIANDGHPRWFSFLGCAAAINGGIVGYVVGRRASPWTDSTGTKQPDEES